MKEFGYVRVSSREQNIDRQMAAMDKLGIEKEQIYVDRQSGQDFKRPRYRALIKKMKTGDILFVKSIDRLGRNYEEILEQWKYLTTVKEIDIVVIDFPLLDTRNQLNGVTGKFIADMVLQIMSYIAQIERENTRSRQAEGIKEALKKGTRFGRPQRELPIEFVEVYKLWKNNTISKREAARKLKVSHTMFARWEQLYQNKSPRESKKGLRVVNKEN